MKKNIQIPQGDTGNERIIFVPERDGLTGVANISFGRYRTNWQAHPAHVHEGCLELCLCARGALVYECNGEQHTILPNNVFIVQPGVSHHLTTAHKGMRIYWLAFRYPKSRGTVLGLSTAETASLVRQLKAVESHVFAVGDEMRELFRRIFRAYDTIPKGAFRTLVLRTLVLQILLFTIEYTDNRPSLKTLAKISRIAELIAKRPSHRFAIAELAAHAQLSVSRFTSLFRQVVGLPPYAYLSKCRLDAARKRLAETDARVCDIAHDLGYASLQHLASQFRKTYGITTTEWRKQHALDGHA